MKPEALDMNGLAVRDVHGNKLGEVTDFYFDVPTSEPEWLVIASGLLDKKSVLVPMEGLQRDEEGLMTPYPKDTIMDAPAVDAAAIDAETEAALYQHYHVRRELPGRTENRAAWEQDVPYSKDSRLRSWKAWTVAT